MYVTRPGKSKKKPYQARIKNKRTGKTQHLGSFASAHLAARAVASALATNEDKDMQSPRKQAQRGAWHPHAACDDTRSCHTYLTGSLKVELKKTSAGSGENESPFTQTAMFGMPAIPVAPVPVTPCFLPPEALAALKERGMVGSVARVLD